ncbi:hypothetical protein [Pseudoxanthomonas sp. Root630]|uniref:hypothetical protein n=1 Tax=Pseudoxanthomonas sp. Root630 TaxID=1736574 RepID=UPI0007032573|nr:hypothetical protein [Pseudoxanthomonas sp. Root630]KRA41512.1 hypothetical protein ASD72_15670 [Pseudoxanthomonas sp. Root630]
MPLTASRAQPSPGPAHGDEVPGLSRFSLYALPATETGATIQARRGLMSRKGVTVEEAAQRADARRREAGKMRRMDRAAWLFLVAIACGGGLAWRGSALSSQTVLLAGYGLLAIALVALLARVTRTTARPPLDAFYLPDELPATAEDIALLRRLANEDPELEVVTNAWWRNQAPIRKGDIRLALDLRRAKLG